MVTLKRILGLPRRAWDRRSHRWGDYVERAALAVAIVFIYVGFQSIQQGRETAQRIVCASNSAVIDAGREIITGGAPKPGEPPTEFERNLEKLGYPPREARRKQAEQAAEAYSRKIARAIERETHIKGLVRPDGTLDCDRLAQVTQ